MPFFSIQVSREVHRLEWADVEIEANSLEEAYYIVQDLCDDGEIANYAEFEGDPENAYATYFIGEDYD